MMRTRHNLVLLITCLISMWLSAADVADLKSADPIARATAARELGGKGDRAAVPMLTPLLDDGTSYVVLAALTALGDIGDETAVPAIEKAVGHGNFAVRTAAIAQMGRIGGKSAAGNLLEIYRGPKSTDPKERAQEQLIAVRALKSCPDPKVVDALIQSEMKNPAVSDAVKRELCINAGLTGDRQYAPMLTGLLGGESVPILCGAAEGLAYLGDNAGIDKMIERLPAIRDFDEARPIRITLAQLTGQPIWHAKQWADWWQRNRATFRVTRANEKR
ncbi:MAG: HEAT repeat domain-containing protein [Planctomycetota bacterium]